jgi:hypothetical protein
MISFPPGEQAERMELVNLLFIWDVVAPYTLTELSLICPKDGKATKASVQLYWATPIPLDVSLHTIAADEVQVEEVEIDDLDIELDVDPTGETE